MTHPIPRPGAEYLGGGRCRFVVWAPAAERVELRILEPGIAESAGPDTRNARPRPGADLSGDEPEPAAGREPRIGPAPRAVAMEPAARGYHTATVDDVRPGARYAYALDGGAERPDPASRHQPRGVHGPSAVIEPAFGWTDVAWTGPALRDYVIYELHVGTFTAEGTFDAVIPHLPALRELGITAIELMPIAQFPGERNWGYDGVQLFAAQDSYGGPDGLRRLVDACHRAGLAVVLDVVYNHLGPEGNYLPEFGPYFTDRYHTPWGGAVNLDDAGSDEVRHFLIENALYWVDACRIDALRLDAVHAIFDQSATHFLQELAAAVHERAARLGRRIQVIVESSLNDPRLVRATELGGYGLDAQWNDEFHHVLRVLLTGEADGYYRDYRRGVVDLARAYTEGFVYTGQHSVFRRRRHGAPSRDVPAGRFVVFAQNHDQVGNRMRGDRLGASVSFEALKLAAGAVLLSPFIPLIFMGEEFGETAPFPYFISHGGTELVEAVRRGRRAEFAAFRWDGEPPDPQDPATFQSAKLDHALAATGEHRVLRDCYATLLRLRREDPVLARRDNDDLEAVPFEASRVLFVRRWKGGRQVALLMNLAQDPARVRIPLPPGEWRVFFDSADPEWHGPGSAVPPRIRSNGEVEVALPPLSLAALRTHEPG